MGGQRGEDRRGGKRATDERRDLEVRHAPCTAPPLCALRNAAAVRDVDGREMGMGETRERISYKIRKPVQTKRGKKGRKKAADKEVQGLIVLVRDKRTILQCAHPDRLAKLLGPEDTLDIGCLG
uniref:Uncharacterized protein n=1 Tax=Oryza glaberrima TaxID=4538 RepID=I1Q324_ORYGL